ncbi:MAG: HAD-IIB family hydrolase [Desulfobacteraceae bacterium]
MMEGKRYIQMFSIHGLVRSHDMELGCDADTGGQVKYVIEMGNALSKHPLVDRVDLFTRLVSDKSVSKDYSSPIEQVTDKFRIVRIQCGGKKYIRKELLWPFLDEFVDKTIKFIKREKRIPNIFHGHYPDGGYAAKELARIFGMPFVYTGHSLGRAKKEQLLNDGYTRDQLNKQLRLDFRIKKEESILKQADLVVTSTRQEVKDQYGMYRNGSLPRFKVIPPGIDIHRFEPYYHDILPQATPSEESLHAKASLIEELNRFFQQPDKPLILALCRPDKRKNIQGLIKAYGDDLDLRSMANLAIFAGIRKDISQKEDSERAVLTRMLLLMDKYNLYGKMAIPKKHDFEHEVPELYHIAAERRGVFVNAALTEPFGITLLEASTTGLPIVATNDGGPSDIVENCQSGLLVDPTDTEAIARAVKEIITQEEQWNLFSKNGILNTRKWYTWESHAETYLQEINALCDQYPPPNVKTASPTDPTGRRLTLLKGLMVTDIDNTLLGGETSDLQRFISLLEEKREEIGFAVATGRPLSSAAAVLEENKIPAPDVIISSVGSEIHYGPSLQEDRGWQTHISRNWDREKIVSVLKDFDFLTPQEESAQRTCKISYTMAPGKDRLAEIHNALGRNRCHYNLIYSQEQYLDILPYRASKGKALRYLSYKWEIPLKRFLVFGDSGNDEEMLRGEPSAVVVGNYSPELEHMKSARKVYFAAKSHAGGMMEGMGHYGFMDKFKKGPHDDN